MFLPSLLSAYPMALWSMKSHERRGRRARRTHATQSILPGSLVLVSYRHRISSEHPGKRISYQGTADIQRCHFVTLCLVARVTQFRYNLPRFAYKERLLYNKGPYSSGACFSSHTPLGFFCTSIPRSLNQRT